MMACRHCGKRAGHTRGCTRPTGKRGRPVGSKAAWASLARAREWYRRFGLDETCISPTGRELYGWLLAEVERLSGV
jgi:hypothetical protein